MFKPGISATAVHILNALSHPDAAVRQAIAEEILTFADLEGQPACIGFAEAFAGEDRGAQIRAANAMARNGILEPRDLDFFRAWALDKLQSRCGIAA